MHFRTKRKIINFRKKCIEILELIIGTAVIAFATSTFLLPNKLSTGGFSGIGTIAYYLFHTPIGTAVFILNLPLFVLAFIKCGKSFFFNAILGTALLSVFLDAFSNIRAPTTDKLLASIYGGIISGIGATMTLKANGSTGGSELLSHIIKKYKPDIKISNLIRILDIGIIIANVVVFSQIEIGLYSAIAIYLSGKMLDIFFEGIDFAKMFLIISPKYKEISTRISKEVKRGTTSIPAMGMYKEKKKNLLLCVVSRQEVRNIRKIVRETDPTAFTIITNAREVFGKGFK